MICNAPLSDDYADRLSRPWTRRHALASLTWVADGPTCWVNCPFWSSTRRGPTPISPWWNRAGCRCGGDAVTAGSAEPTKAVCASRVGPDAGRWAPHRVAHLAVAGGILLFPVVLSAGASVGFTRVVVEPPGAGRFVWWWPAMMVVSLAALILGERLARRAAPLKLLLSLDIVFPGEAPRRLSVARRAASTRGLARRVEEARTTGITDEPTVAAEKIVTLAMSLNAHDTLCVNPLSRKSAFECSSFRWFSRW